MYKQRLLLDNDGTSFFVAMMTDDVSVDIRREVGRIPNNVTTVLLCPNAGGAFYHPTEAGDRYPPAAELNRAFDNAIDPFGMYLGEVKMSGREAMVTYRMNDVHEADKADSPMTASFKRRNPQLTIGYAEMGEEFFSGKKYPWMKYCLNYAKTEVQDYILSTLDELCKYDIDGLQLDWMRFPAHLPGNSDQVWAARDSITEFVTKARAVMDNNGRGRSLGVRVPTTLKGCRDLGLDLEQWADGGLIDFVTISPFLSTDPVMPVNEFKELFHDTIPVYTAIEFDNSRQPHTHESIRATALSLSECGSDGIYLFNFPCWPEYIAVTPYHWLNGLDYEEGRSVKPLHFVIPFDKYRVPVDQPRQLPKIVDAGGSVEFDLLMPKKALPAQDAMILIQAPANDRMDVTIDGVPLVQLKKNRQHDLFIEFLNHFNPKEGGYIAESPSLIHIFRIGQDALNPGDWKIRVENTGDAPFEIVRINIGLW